MESLAAGPELDYYVLDVFTDRAYAGNPLAVVLGADALSSAQLQQIAREFHLSETAFPMAFGADEGVDYRLRIFTPEVELPFAGHPSVGTAWLMAQLGLVKAGRVVQLCGAGALPLDVAEDGGPVELSGGQPTCSDPVDPAPMLAAVGLTAQDLVDPDRRPARVCGTGIGYGILDVRPDALEKCRPDMTALAGFAHPISSATGVYVAAWDSGNRSARARMFAGDVGVTEDAATGSAALAYGVWLAAAGVLTSSGTYEVVQGVEMGRRSVLSCTVDIEDGRATGVRVRGDVVPVARGTITPPPA